MPELDDKVGERGALLVLEGVLGGFERVFREAGGEVTGAVAAFVEVVVVAVFVWKSLYRSPLAGW